jgi:hypothetical protein
MEVKNADLSCFVFPPCLHCCLDRSFYAKQVGDLMFRTLECSVPPLCETKESITDPLIIS